jgi:hypothetical protein
LLRTAPLDVAEGPDFAADDINSDNGDADAADGVCWGWLVRSRGADFKALSCQVHLGECDGRLSF